MSIRAPGSPAYGVEQSELMGCRVVLTSRKSLTQSDKNILLGSAVVVRNKESCSPKADGKMVIYFSSMVRSLMGSTKIPR